MSHRKKVNHFGGFFDKHWKQLRCLTCIASGAHVQTHTPVIEVLLLLAATSGSVVVAGRRTRTTIVRKLIIQTPGRKLGREEGRKKEDLCEVSGQAVLQQTLGGAHLARPVKAELAALCVLHQTDISLVDGLCLLPSNKFSFLPSCATMFLLPLTSDQCLITRLTSICINYQTPGQVTHLWRLTE